MHCHLLAQHKRHKINVGFWCSQAQGKRNTELEQQLAAEKEKLANIKDAKRAAGQSSQQSAVFI